MIHPPTQDTLRVSVKSMHGLNFLEQCTELVHIEISLGGVRKDTEPQQVAESIQVNEIDEFRVFSEEDVIGTLVGQNEAGNFVGLAGFSIPHWVYVTCSNTKTVWVSLVEIAPVRDAEALPTAFTWNPLATEGPSELPAVCLELLWMSKESLSIVNAAIIDFDFEGLNQNPYVQYEIVFVRKDGAAWRRYCKYQELADLKNNLSKCDPLLKQVPFPGRYFFKNRFKISFIVERMKGLENWLNALLARSYQETSSLFASFLYENASIIE